MKKLSIRDKFWKDHIIKWESSGLSQGDYCRKAGINYKSFSARRSSFRKQGIISTTEDMFIPVKKKVNKEIAIKLSNGLELYFDQLPEVNWLGSFVKQFGDNNAIHG